MFVHGYACGAGWAGGVEIEIVYIYIFIYLWSWDGENQRKWHVITSKKLKIKTRRRKEERGKEGGTQANFENFEWQSETVSFWFGSLYTSYEREIETCC